MRRGKIDFVGIGAEKSATRWVGKCLGEHPEICLGEESGGSEIFYFNEYDPHLLKVRNVKYDWGMQWYMEHFDHCPNGSVKGEISPTYLYGKESARRIKKDLPEAKIIVCLRNPVDRALSQYLHDVKIGISLPIGFERALRANKTYIEKGKYNKHLTNYFKIFGKRRIMVVLFDEIEKRPGKVMRELYEFLGLKDIGFIPKTLKIKVNVAKKPKLAIVNYVMIRAEYALKQYKLWWVLKVLENIGVRKKAFSLSHEANTKPLGRYPKMKKVTRRYLLGEFENDINCLEKLINRDLSAWKK